MVRMEQCWQKWWWWVWRPLNGSPLISEVTPKPCCGILGFKEQSGKTMWPQPLLPQERLSFVAWMGDSCVKVTDKEGRCENSRNN